MTLIFVRTLTTVDPDNVHEAPVIVAGLGTLHEPDPVSITPPVESKVLT